MALDQSSFLLSPYWEIGALGKLRNLKWTEDYVASEILWKYGVRDETEFKAGVEDSKTGHYSNDVLVSALILKLLFEEEFFVKNCYGGISEKKLKCIYWRELIYLKTIYYILERW